jgi:hypothetical protein
LELRQSLSNLAALEEPASVPLWRNLRWSSEDLRRSCDDLRWCSKVLSFTIDVQGSIYERERRLYVVEIRQDLCCRSVEQIRKRKRIK